MPMRDNREYRNIEYTLCADKVEDKELSEEEKSYRVSGYATTFDTPYVLFEEDGITYYEKIDRNALVGCDISDVIFQYNHKGRVFARTRNNTLELLTDDHGLMIKADLSSTELSRQMFEDIDTGLIDKMSFGFTVAEDSYDNATHTRTIKRLKKIYDVSCVDFPANDGTEIGISTRSLISGYAEKEKAEMLKLEEINKQKQRIKIMTMCN